MTYLKLLKLTVLTEGRTDNICLVFSNFKIFIPTLDTQEMSQQLYIVDCAISLPQLN